VRGLGDVGVDDVPTPSVGPGEVLVRMRCAAICGSDLHGIYLGYPPLLVPGRPGAPGHEGVGEVIESRSEQRAVGDVVLTVPDRVHAGAFAELQALPARYALPVPGEIEATTMVLAQQFGTVLFALDKFWPGAPGRDAVVIGAGPAGLHFVRLLKQRGFETVIAADVLEHRRRSAEAIGADVTIDAASDSVSDAVMTATGGRGADLVVEAAGRNVARQTAFACVRKGGVVGLFGLPEGYEPLTLAFHEVFERQPIVRVSDGAQHEPQLRSFRRAITELVEHPADLAGLSTHVLPFADFDVALATAQQRADGVTKVAVVF
jgi:L-iditol 2-dehydrogenase